MQSPWSGYTWDPALFPDPAGFLAWCEARGLKTPLNLHPASGVQPHERAYPEMARAMGVDPETKRYVPFDITNKTFARNYFEILHRPLERQGVDFWWLDWQQYPETKVTGTNNTWWLNYVHTTDMERRGLRPLIFHRWGGLGNHRPILRTHTTKNPDAERRIWAYPEPFATVMRDAFLLRYALIPYLYTAARQTYETGVAFLRPLYYDYPDRDEAYAATHEYLFGDSMLVAPITTGVNGQTSLATQSVWLPPGAWIEWFTGSALDGPARVDRRFGLEEIPVYVKAGAIVPMQRQMRHTREKPVDPLILTIFPGATTGTTRVYEDDGAGLGYTKDAFEWTPASYERAADGTTTIRMGPAEGRFPDMLKERGYEIRLPGALPPRPVTYAGRAVSFATSTDPCAAPCWTVEGRTLTRVIMLPRTSVSQRVEASIAPAVATPEQLRAADGFAGRLARILCAMETLNRAWPKGWSPEPLVEAAQTGRRIEIDPASAAREVDGLARRWPAIIQEIRKQDVDPALITRALAQLGDWNR